MNGNTMDDIQFEKKLRLQRKLIWGTIYLGGGLALTIATIAFQIWIYLYNGRISTKLALLGIAGAVLIYKGIVTFRKGETKDSDDSSSGL